jgi:DtxR family transcriptional regulator, Mn-dependent transcriptional regulator
MPVADDQDRRVTPAIEDYLKAIYLVQQRAETVTTSLLAEQLGGLKPGSVSGMVKKLADLGYVAHTPYYGVGLTSAGERIALEVIRHHRLIELYLVEALGYSWDEVHDDADQLEHVISEKLEARIAARLGHPTIDPHGDPIPTLEGIMPDARGVCLVDIPLGDTCRVVRVGEQHSDRLRYLADLGLTPGTILKIVAIAPFEGPISVQIGAALHALDRRLAQTIFVER